MSDLNKIVDELSKLSVMEAAELSKLLQEKWGVSAAAPVAVATAAGDAASADQAAAKDTFDVILTDVGDKKINIIGNEIFDDEELLCYSSFFQVSSHRHNWREESQLGFDSVSQAVPLRHENQN